MATHSPTPNKSPTPKKASSTVEVSPTMSFYEALRLIVSDGGYATKVEWNNPNVFMTMNGETLCLHMEDNLLHPFIVRDADILGEDWVFISDPSAAKSPKP